MTEAPPIGTSQGLFHLTETMPAYAGSYLHRWDSPVHTHSFVEIAFAVGGTATHHSQAGRREMNPGDVLLLRPGVWHGYENCQRFEVYNCCSAANCCAASWPGPVRTRCSGSCCGPARTHLPAAAC